MTLQPTILFNTTLGKGNYLVSAEYEKAEEVSISNSIESIVQRRLQAMNQEDPRIIPEPKEQHVLFSVQPRSDFTSTVKFPNDETMTLKTKFLRGNDPDIPRGVVSSSDRSSHHLLMGRTIYKDDQPLVFTGRPDTEQRAVEHIRNILSAYTPDQRKNFMIENEDGSISIRYFVGSLLSPTQFANPSELDECYDLHAEHHLLETTLPEKRYSAKDLGIGDDDEKKYKLEPIHMNFQMNVWNRFSLFSGKTSSHSICKNAIQQIGKLFSKELQNNSFANSIFKFLSKNIQIHRDVLSEKQLLVLSHLLMKELQLPIAYHCKSSTDRTSIAVSLAALADDVKNHHYQDTIQSMLDRLEEEEFKEKFLAVLFSQLPVTATARSLIYPETDPKTHKPIGIPRLGFKFGGSFLTQNPVLVSLLPKRYLRPTILHPIFLDIPNTLLQSLLWILLIIGITLIPVIMLISIMILPFLFIGKGIQEIKKVYAREGMEGITRRIQEFFKKLSQRLSQENQDQEPQSQKPSFPSGSIVMNFAGGITDLLQDFLEMLTYNFFGVHSIFTNDSEMDYHYQFNPDKQFRSLVL